MKKVSRELRGSMVRTGIGFTLLFSSALWLVGCESDTMRYAPHDLSQPWQGAVDAKGHLLSAGQASDGEMRAAKHGLRLPEGFRLPVDHSLPQQPLGAVKIQADHSYGLAELIDLAQSHNPQTRMAWDAARASAAAVGIARSSYLPQLTASVVGGYTTLQPRTNLSGLLNGPTNIHLNITKETEQVGLQWLLFDFGKRHAVMEEARQNNLAQNILFTGAHQKVVYEVATAYYQYVAALSHVDLVTKSLENAYEIERAARANLRHGQGTRIDTAQAEQAVAEAELVMAHVRGDVENKRLDLLTAMGLDPALRINVQRDKDRHISVEDIRLSDAMVRDAVSRRPDVLAAYTRLHAAHNAVQGARASFLPQIFVSGNVGYGYTQFSLKGLPIGGGLPLNGTSNMFTGGITGGISVPIFDGGLRRNRLKQAHNQEDSARAQMQDVQDNAVRTIVSAENTLHAGIVAYHAAEKLQTASQIGFDAALTAYRAGDGSMTRMLELQNALLNARLTASDSYYAMLVAAASLAFSAGTLSGGDVLTDVGASLYEHTP